MSQPSRRLQPPPLYAILDPEQTKGRATETVLRELLAGGIKLLQLRAKVMPAGDFLRLARVTRSLTRSYGCSLIVNDRVDIALACEADGVHLGQEDLPLHAARKLMGDKMIGISTHEVEQAREAEARRRRLHRLRPDVRDHNESNRLQRARAWQLLRQVRDTVSIPIVAIGGITEANIAEVWQAGADSAAIISDLLDADDIAEKVKRILALRAKSI